MKIKTGMRWQSGSGMVIQIVKIIRESMTMRVLKIGGSCRGIGEEYASPYTKTNLSNNHYCGKYLSGQESE